MPHAQGGDLILIARRNFNTSEPCARRLPVVSESILRFYGVANIIFVPVCEKLRKNQKFH